MPGQHFGDSRPFELFFARSAAEYSVHNAFHGFVFTRILAAACLKRVYENGVYVTQIIRYILRRFIQFFIAFVEFKFPRGAFGFIDDLHLQRDTTQAFLRSQSFNAQIVCGIVRVVFREHIHVYSP